METAAPPSSRLADFPPATPILLVRLRSLGDIVLLTPALRLLKQWRPDLRLSLLVESRFKELLKMIPEVDEALTLRDPSGDGSAFQIARVIRRHQFQLCLNLHGGPTSHFLTALSGARWKAGFAHFRMKRIYDLLIPDARLILRQPQIHTAEHQAAALFWLDMPSAPLPRSRLVVHAEDLEWWETERVLLDLPHDCPYAVLHPAALYATKQWPPERFAQLGEYLEKQAGLMPLYSVGPGESATLDAVQRSSPRPIRRLEGATLGQLAAALQGARLFVGNDSGPAHMAQALGVPAVVIFGSSSSVIWGPWPREDRNHRTWVVQNEYPCNPCPGDHCYRYPKPECILSVSLEQVQQAVESLLRTTATASESVPQTPPSFVPERQKGE